MDYEEKLRLAKEALKSGSYDRKTIEYIFPELKESEEEKIRKEIISALKYANHKGIYDKHITWLEKQGKSKFEQCIQEGDKIVTNEDGTHFNVNQLERVAKKEPKFPSLSEKEIVCLKRILDFLREEHNSYTGKDFTNEIAVLEWFITHPVLRVAKVAWSEDDENKVTLFMQLTEGCDNEEELVDWLKSLKDRMKGE